MNTPGFEIQNGIVSAGDGTGLANLLRAGKTWLELHLEQVNALNVFPVPDGDTGVNMFLTLRAAADSAERFSGAGAGAVAQAAAQAAMIDARGNSGLILSQLLQGLARGLAHCKHFTAADWASAFQLGVEMAYRSVVHPVEGTILTVASAAAQAARDSAARRADLLEMFRHVVQAAQAAQAATPDLLPALKQAGVTDSGGLGLVYFLQGALRFLQNEPLERPAADLATPVAALAPAVEEEYGYDVQFLIRGHGLDVAAIRQGIDALGWSTVVVGDELLVKVHLHTTDPGPPLSLGAQQGIISEVVVENLSDQARTFLGNASPAHPAETGDGSPSDRVLAVLAVAPGDGLAEIFRSLGVEQVVVSGGSPPSADELLHQARQMRASHVLILPNSGMVLDTVQRPAAVETGITVLPTRTVPQGIAAVLAFNRRLGLEENLQRMEAAARQVVSLALHQPDGKTGVTGWLDGKAVCRGSDFLPVLSALLEQVDLPAAELATIYYGQSADTRQAETLAGPLQQRFPGLEVEIYFGAQPDADYIISLE